MTVGQEGYYAELASERYYTSSGEPPGQWWGGATNVLGVSGQVTPEELASISSGFTPRGESPLVRNAGAEGRRPGFDCTFGAPKSVTLAWSLGSEEDRRAVLAAHRVAVEKALEYLQTEAGRTRRGAQGHESIAADLLVAQFEHSSARAVGDTPDPHLHTHCLVMNACLGEDGKWGTLDARDLFRHKMTAGVLYRTALFTEMRNKLGLSAARREKWVELEGVPDAVLEHFSKRRKAIESLLEERGKDSAKDAARAALDTRQTKTTVNRSELFPKWREAAVSLGFDWSQVEGMAQGEPETGSLSEEEFVRRAVENALTNITEHRAHFAKRELLRAVLEKMEPLGISTDIVQESVSNQIEQLVALASVRGEVRYTTQEMLELEQSVIKTTRHLSFRRHTVSDSARVSAVASSTMSEEQQNAFEHVTGKTCISFVQGLAGTGKSYMLRAARLAFVGSGFTVHGAALAAVAAKNLESESGIESSSIHKLLFDLEKGRKHLDRNSVVVIDEAGMVGTKLFHQLLERVDRARAKLVLVGDDKQLSAVSAGGPFAALLREHEHAEMSDIRRQRDGWAKRAVRLFSEGRGGEALFEYAKRGLVHQGETDEDAFKQLAADWDTARSGEEGLKQTLVLAGTRAQVAKLNRTLQQVRFDAGELDASDGVMIGEDLVLAGDRVRFRKNSPLVKNGEVGEVVAVSSEANTLTVRLDGTEDRVTLDLEEYSSLELGYACTTHAAQGQTVDRALVFLGGFAQDREMTYVQASRARAETRFYLGEDAIESGGLEALAGRVEQSRAEGLACELLERTMQNSHSPEEQAA